jgi:hypothetical protein
LLLAASELAGRGAKAEKLAIKGTARIPIVSILCLVISRSYFRLRIGHKPYMNLGRE